MATKLRILCLHGYTQNPTIFRARTGALRKATKNLAEMVFIPGPYPVVLPTADTVEERERLQSLQTEPNEETAQLSWFRVTDDASGRRLTGLQSTLDVIRTALVEQVEYNGFWLRPISTNPRLS
ncbi:hypothetical protein IWQ60_008186 [Tieghemiomyces parasiticus]|uniref:Serine hydrolase domain-containing protein n=1 Tax=Tieghemiomyces parasiticus TaxID=78921 RepID=A0A9W8DS85_9FUNG|nr:hypothetical protein IWQ60_008186 [Tieghemiomyces parasiticus]